MGLLGLATSQNATGNVKEKMELYDRNLFFIDFGDFDRKYRYFTKSGIIARS